MVQLLSAPFSLCKVILVVLSDQQVLCDGTGNQEVVSLLHATFALVPLNTARSFLGFPK